MKTKNFDLRRVSLLKLHAIVFMLGMVLLWYNVIATITYQGNASVPFEVFKPFILERGNLAMLWAMLLLFHFGAQVFWNTAQRRARESMLEGQYDDARLREPVKVKRDESFLYDDADEEQALSNLL